MFTNAFQMHEFYINFANSRKFISTGTHGVRAGSSAVIAKACVPVGRPAGNYYKHIGAPQNRLQATVVQKSES